MKKAWLIAFNLITLIIWSLFFAHAIKNGFSYTKEGAVLLAVAQGLAIFEILNAVLKIAGANWVLTTLQVFSRFLIVALFFWIPAWRWIEISHYTIVHGFMFVSVAWSITEMIRALYYLTEILNKPIGAITYSRYTFFILLYPLGVLGEFMVMFCLWEFSQFEISFINVALLAVALSYFVLFPKLFGHMLKQRKKKLS